MTPLSRPDVWRDAGAFVLAVHRGDGETAAAIWSGAADQRDLLEAVALLAPVLMGAVARWAGYRIDIEASISAVLLDLATDPDTKGTDDE